MTGPARQQLAFWPITADLPEGCVLAFSDLQDAPEAQAIFPGIRFDQPYLQAHPCVEHVGRADKLNVVDKITKSPTRMCPISVLAWR